MAQWFLAQGACGDAGYQLQEFIYSPTSNVKPFATAIASCKLDTKCVAIEGILNSHRTFDYRTYAEVGHLNTDWDEKQCIVKKPEGAITPYLHEDGQVRLDAFNFPTWWVGRKLRKSEMKLALVNP